MSKLCAICGNPTFAIQNPLCSTHYQQWTISGVYTEVTLTGTFQNPAWLLYLIRQQASDEAKMYNRELTFSDLSDDRQ